MAVDWGMFFRSIGQGANDFFEWQENQKKEEAAARAGSTYRMAMQQPDMTQEKFLSLVGRQQKRPIEFSQAMEAYSRQFPTVQEQETRQAIEQNRLISQQDKLNQEARVRQGTLRTISDDVADQAISVVALGAPGTATPEQLEKYYEGAVPEAMSAISPSIGKMIQDYGFNPDEDSLKTVISKAKSKVINHYVKKGDPVGRLAGIIAQQQRISADEARETKKQINMVRAEGMVSTRDAEFKESLQDIIDLQQAYDIKTWRSTGQGDEKKYPGPRDSDDDNQRKNLILSQYEKYGRKITGNVAKLLQSKKEYEVISSGKSRGMGPADLPELEQIAQVYVPYVEEKLGKRIGKYSISIFDPQETKKKIMSIMAGVFPLQNNIIDALANSIFDLMKK